MEKNHGRSWKIPGISWDMGENGLEFTAKNPSGVTRRTSLESEQWELDREIIEHWGFMIFSLEIGDITNSSMRIWYDKQFLGIWPNWGVGRFRQTDKRYSSTNHRVVLPNPRVDRHIMIDFESWDGLKSGRDGTMLQSTDGLESSNGWMSKRCMHFP